MLYKKIKLFPSIYIKVYVEFFSKISMISYRDCNLIYCEFNSSKKQFKLSMLAPSNVKKQQVEEFLKWFFLIICIFILLIV